MLQIAVVRRLVPVVLAASVLNGTARGASACLLDQRPSVSANGQRAQLNRVVPHTQAQLAQWTFFVFTRPLAAGQPVVLTEDRRQVARTIMPAALEHPWGWQLGDGQVAQGWTIRHTYTQAGRYRIRIFCWNPEAQQWEAFDQVTIRIR